MIRCFCPDIMIISSLLWQEGKMAAVEHYVYKYLWNNQVIYIGKVDSDLQRRVEEHAKEEKFQPYLDQSDIFCIPLVNQTETTFLELYLINKYKPILNFAAKYEGISNIQVQEPPWIPYSKYLETKKRTSDTDKLQNIQKEIVFWKQVLSHLQSSMAAGQESPSQMFLTSVICPEPIPVGFLDSEGKAVSILSFSSRIGNTVFCSFRKISDSSIISLKKHLGKLRQTALFLDNTLKRI